MFSRIVISGVLLGLLSGISASTVQAGVDKLHKQSVERGLVCMSKHYHFVASGAWPSKAQAMATAKRRWERFTGLEYGRAWGSLKIAGSVTWSCGASKSHRGTQWSCDLKARPCHLP